MEPITKTIEDVANAICDNYCKFPGEYFSKYSTEDDAEEHLYSEKCNNCVLNKLY